MTIRPGDTVTYFFEYGGKVHPRNATVTIVHSQDELTLEVEMTDEDRAQNFIAFQDYMRRSPTRELDEIKGGSWLPSAS